MKMQWLLSEKPFENNKVLQKYNLINVEYSKVVPRELKVVIFKKHCDQISLKITK